MLADSLLGSRVLSKLPALGDCTIPKAIYRQKGKFAQLRSFGVHRDDAPKTQLHRVYLEILIGVEKLEKVAQGQESTLTGQSSVWAVNVYRISK